jgi:hypothetical protein
MLRTVPAWRVSGRAFWHKVDRQWNSGGRPCHARLRVPNTSSWHPYQTMCNIAKQSYSTYSSSKGYERRVPSTWPNTLDSSVNRLDCRLDNPASYSWQREGFVSLCRRDLTDSGIQSVHLSIQWVSGALSSGQKRCVSEADHWHPPRADFKNVWSFTSSSECRGLFPQGRSDAWVKLIIDIHLVQILRMYGALLPP